MVARYREAQVAKGGKCTMHTGRLSATTLNSYAATATSSWDAQACQVWHAHIHDEDVGFVEQYLGHADALAIAFGELGDGLFEHVAEEALLGNGFDAVMQAGAGEPARFAEEAEEAERGDRLTVDLSAGTITNQRTGQTHPTSPFPASIMGIIQAGGLVPFTRKRLQTREKAAS